MNKNKTSMVVCLICFLIFLIAGISELVLAKDIMFKPEVNINKKVELDKIDLHLTSQINDSGFSLPEFYFTFEAFDSLITIGRKYNKLGPGYFSQLMLSDMGTPLNMLSWEGDFTWYGEEIEYFQMIAYLDEGVNKQLFVHRLTNNTLFDNLEIGVSEAVMASKVIHPAYYNPFPLWPYYLTAKIIGLSSEYNSHEDKYIGADFIYQFDNGAQLYGELLVDEYAQVSWANNPDKRAHLIGGYYPINSKTELRAEYSNVFNYVYLHRFPENRYTYNDKYIGHWLGNDGDVLDIEVKRDISDNQEVKVGLRFIRKGIGDMETDYGPDHQEKKFLSIITEESVLLRSGYWLAVNKSLSLGIEAELGKNFLLEGVEEDIFNLACSINMEL